jgi:hypothetical protein
MNKTEEAYSRHLEALRKQDLIETWAFEPETLRIGPNTRYCPDFRIVKNSIIEFHEVKGGTRSKNGASIPYVHDDGSLIKLKVCSDIHPMYKFILVWKNGTSWEVREIN